MIRLRILLFMICIAVFFAGCGNSKEENMSNTEFIEEQTTETENVSHSTEDEETVEPSQTEEVRQMGLFSLEECLGYEGMYSMFEDGSFTPRSLQGYCLGGKGYIDGMYLDDDNLYAEFDGTKKLVLFWEDEYSITLYPVAAQISVIQLEKEDGTEGFARFNEDTSALKVDYRDHTRETIKLQTINGKAPEEYEAEYVKVTVDSSGDTFISLNGFQQNTEVTLGIVQGTAIEENEYEVNATYYECSRASNHYEEEYSYYVKTIPTAQGYAELDFSQIPDGKYVMVLWFNGYSNYRAGLLELQRN